MFPDFYNARIGRQKLTSVITDESWLKTPLSQQLASEARRSLRLGRFLLAASAANAVVDTVET